MATILIIDDRALDRKLLTAILQPQGHQIIEVSDGQDALDALPHISPDVVISDIVMPTVDGYEVVRRLRDIPALAATPVIFHTAIYHEREARALARQCGVFDILTKPTTHRAIVAAVDAALGSNGVAIRGDGPRLVSTTPAARIDRFDVERERTKAILELAEQMAAQRNPAAVLDRACAGARHVTLAQQAILGLVTAEGSPRAGLHTSGFDRDPMATLQSPPADGSLLAAVVQERRPVRTRNQKGGGQAPGLHADPSVCSWLSVPIATSRRVYGWLSLRNKLGTDEFTDSDEHAALTLGAHAGIAYETARLLEDLQRRVAAHGSDLQRASIRIREEERAELSRTLHDRMGQELIGMKMDLHWVAAQLPGSGASPEAGIGARVDSILHRLGLTIQSVRTIASELRPAVLDQLGLIAAIQWQAADFERQSGIHCRVDSRIREIDLEPRRAAAVFRIIQEALTNVLQHAHATRATVTVRREARSLAVSVTDDGRGIPEHDLTDDDSLGLIGMRERCALLGGTLDVRRRRPRGTVVRCTVPLAEKHRKRRKPS